jgi:hypothetical protein
MNAAGNSLPLRSRRALPALALLATAGIGVGWFVVPHHSRGFGYVHALLHPLAVGTLCVLSLSRPVKQTRWIVPLLLLGVLLDIAVAPHEPRLTTVSVVAGALALLAMLFGRNRLAIVGTVLCCSAIAATLSCG